MRADPRTRAAQLSCWSAAVGPVPLGGGITNTNFVVTDRGETFVVRIGDDIPLHGIVRAHEREVSAAAHACGLSPEVVHHEPGALVLRFVTGRVLTAADLRTPTTLARVVPLIRTCHMEMPRHLPTATLMFWVFHVCHRYLATAGASACRVAAQLPHLAAMNVELERALGAITPVFAHNDLMPGNFIDDGTRIWLLDWEYAGWNTPLFDLANLAANSELPADLEEWILATYFGRPPDATLRRAYAAAKCASLLRETLWSVVQEQHSMIDFDYARYTDDLLARLQRAHADFAREGAAS